MTAMLSRLFLLACLLASPAALGQTYPDRNVTIVVTSAAGAWAQKQLAEAVESQSRYAGLECRLLAPSDGCRFRKLHPAE
jgi:tripartite-type tricarboxylate transporter receptor subunit TctC